MTLWTTDDLLSRAKRKAQWPGNPKLTDTEILAIADEELQSFIAPLVRSTREAYWLKDDDRSITPNNNEFRIPTLATSGSVYDVILIDTNQNTRVLARIETNDRYRWRAAPTITGWPRFYEVVGDIIRIFPILPSPGFTLRIRYERRPSKLVATSACALVATVGGSTLTSVTSLGSTTVDVVQANPDFDIVVTAKAETISGSGPYTYTFSGVDLTSVAMNDWICPTGQTCIPPIPDVMQFALIDRVAAEMLDEAGDYENADRIRTALDPKLTQSMKSIEPRVPTEVPVVYNRFSTLRVP